MLNPIFRQWSRTATSVFAMLFLLVVVSSKGGQSEGGNRLAFWVLNFDWETAMILFDPGKGIQELFIGDIGYTRFPFSRDGRIAFSSINEDGKADILILDTDSENLLPINLSKEINIEGSPLTWSPDGRYLAFESHQDNNKLIYIWDGETVIDITPADTISTPESYGVSWSPDGRLTVTVSFGYASDSPKSEIYIWDGNKTSNLSQNPNGEDRWSTWSFDGKVAFLSGRDDEHDIFVWDGISVKDGMPDISTFMNVAPELTEYYSFPTWTTDGHLAFDAQTPTDSHVQIYLWDGQGVTNISQNPGLHNGSPQWNEDGNWAFSTFFSSQQLIYVRDAENRTILTTDGQYPPAWSSDGQLVFCNRSTRGWSLLIWDGRMITEIAQGWEIWAQWQGGSGVVCSSG